jgi:PHD/YefM family antitoxin component YafN of YafNO toxin-antitoxin module
MPGHEPINQTLSTVEAGSELRKLVKRLSEHETRILVEHDGVPVAAIISARDFERLRALEIERRRDFSVIDEMRDVFRDVPAEEIEREVAKALAEVRQEMKEEREAGRRTEQD